jgi:hypothetical protein
VTRGPHAAVVRRNGTDTFVAQLYGSQNSLENATFSPDGERILTAGEEGAVRLYRCEICGSLRDLVALGEKRLLAPAAG